VAEGEAFAINSGCLMRVAWLKKIGGFSNDFWLDYSDIYACHQIFVRGGKVWRATDAELEHEMTVMDYDRLMSPWRYTNFSHAESAFNDLYKGYAENAMQNLRLLARAIKQRRKYRNPEFSRITLAQLIYRLTVPRRRRIQQWIAAGEERRAKIMRGPLRTEQRVFQ
jgi:GT2 family glycosyltransferase